MAVHHKLGPYRRMAALDRPLPLLVVRETGRGRNNFLAAASPHGAAGPRFRNQVLRISNANPLEAQTSGEQGQ